MRQCLLSKRKLASSRDAFKYDSSEHIFYPELSDCHGRDGRKKGIRRNRKLTGCLKTRKENEGASKFCFYFLRK